MTAEIEGHVKARAILYGQDAVSAAAALVAAALGTEETLVAQIGHLTEEIFALPEEERAAKLVGLLGSFAGLMAFALAQLAVAANAACIEDGASDPLRELHRCEIALAHYRDGSAGGRGA